MYLSTRFPGFPSAFSDRWFRPDAFFESFFGRSGRAAGVFPAVNLYDNGSAFLLRAELPGVDPSSLEIEAKGDQLTVKGARPPPAEDGRTYHRRETEFGTFERTVTLPQPFDSDAVEAQLKDGLLEIRLPRHASAQPRKIAVH